MPVVEHPSSQESSLSGPLAVPQRRLDMFGPIGRVTGATTLTFVAVGGIEKSREPEPGAVTKPQCGARTLLSGLSQRPEPKLPKLAV